MFPYWLLLPTYMILILVSFGVCKLLKHNFTYKSVALLSLATSSVLYTMFIFSNDIIIVSEIILYIVTMLVYTMIVYWLGRNIYIKIKPKKQQITA